MTKGDVVVCLDASMAEGWLREGEIYEVTSEPEESWTGQSLVSVSNPELVKMGREESAFAVPRFEVVGDVR
jgi:hypothetical protein